MTAKKQKNKSEKKAVPAKAGRPSALVDTRVVWCGDCLEQLQKLPDQCVDLIYIDPPFNSNRNYEVFWGETKEVRAFEDRHASTQAYLDYMRPRCVELHRVLKETGSFYYHCDWHASHYVKVMLDQIWGENQFQNEVVWQRFNFHADANKWGRLHDVLLFYTKSNEYVFNKQRRDYDESYIKSHFKQDEDGRMYTLDNAVAAGQGPARVFFGKTIEPKLGTHWRWSQENIDKLIDEGRIVLTKNGWPRVKRYLDEMKGHTIGDVWTDISEVNSQAKERLGYPTQKPLSLLERIIQASSNENDIVLDAFCGCGTALVAAQKLGRQWIGIDVSPTACRVMAKRLRDVCGMKEDEALWKAGRGFIVRDLPWTEEKLRKIPPFEFENWAVIALGGIPNKTKVGDHGIDGRIFPPGAVPQKRGDLFDDIFEWYPIQVKQKDKAGRPDIDAFEAMMTREDRSKGFFVSFDYSRDALAEIQAFFKKSKRLIIPLTVKEILEEQIAMKLG